MTMMTNNKHLGLICCILSLVLLLSVSICAEPSAETGEHTQVAIAVFDKDEYSVTIGSSIMVTVTCDDDDANITFEIENEKIAKIDDGGVITTKKAGTTKIYVLVNDVRQDSTAKLIVSNAKLTEDSSLIYGFDVGESIENCQNDVSEYFNIDKDIVNIYVDDSTLADPTDKIATGMSIEFGDDTYYAVIRGDVNGDGEIDYSDMKAAICYLSGEEYIAGEAYRAACLIGDDEFTLECILRLSRSIEGKYTIEQ